MARFVPIHGAGPIDTGDSPFFANPARLAQILHETAEET